MIEEKSPDIVKIMSFQRLLMAKGQLEIYEPCVHKGTDCVLGKDGVPLSPRALNPLEITVAVSS